MKTPETETNDYVLLKWGTLKGWHLHDSPKAFELLKEWSSLGESYSAMAQRDTPRQKELICQIIDECVGIIQNDWTGEIYTNKEDAKKYVMEYNSKS